jgi:hypothetical protein
MTYDLSDIMDRAWRSYRQGHLPFAHHLRRIWRCVKAERAIEMHNTEIEAGDRDRGRTAQAPVLATNREGRPAGPVILTGATAQRLLDETRPWGVRPLTKGWA